MAKPKKPKDYTRYSFNGQENLTKKDLAGAVCKKYYEDNPGITFEAFEKLFPKKVILEDMVKDESRVYPERYDLNDGRRVAISNQWGKKKGDKDPWNLFLTSARELGYTINEMPSKSKKHVSSDSNSLAWNRIYFGAPGTGKSHQLNEEAETKFGKNFERVTFYPTYSYQQFVGSYKPVVSKTGDITYCFVFGPLMRLLLKAWEAEEGYQDALEDLEALKSADEKDKDQVAINAAEAQVKANRFVLIVEELNRAEAAAVFGDFFQLLDRDENGESEYEISPSEELRLALGWDENKKLYFPSNFYIWATMNNADQGVMPLDTAFKRRWDFEYIDLDNGDGELKEPEEKLWNELRTSINKGLRKLAVNEDKLLGPFFMKAKREDFWKTFCDKVVLYLYEDAARLRRKDCFKKANVTYSELRKAFMKPINDLDACKKVLSEHFNFEMTLSKPWLWPSETDSKDDASGETSGAQGESTSDNR